MYHYSPSAMPTILAPAPRLPPQHSQLLSGDQQPSVPLLSPHPQHTRTLLSPPRLLSPIGLHDPLHAKSPTSCGPSHKRRSLSRLLARSSRRRRLVQRVESPFGTSIFDQLPWVSALDVPSPVHCDVADLSQLPLDEDLRPFSDAMPASGPVRRRKISLRSNPLGSGRESPPGESLLRQHLPIHQPTGPLLDCPRTPPPRVPFDPSRVTFRNLMPVFPRGINPSTPF